MWVREADKAKAKGRLFVASFYYTKAAESLDKWATELADNDQYQEKGTKVG